MTFIDSHTHLFSDKFDQDIDQVIQRALAQDITEFILPNINLATVDKMLNLSALYPGKMHPAIGLHPCDVKENYEDELNHVEEMLSQRQFYAVGEIGIDLYWDKTTLEIQKKAFKHQIQLAKKYKLPIVIHCREAFDEIFEVLETEKSDDLFGIFHCFTGTLEQAHRVISFNMKLGIGGVVTFKNGKIDQFLNQVDLNHVVLETDAPYLSPVPYRGKRNESAYIINVLEKLSDVYKKPIEDIAAITTQNSKDVFKI